MKGCISFIQNLIKQEEYRISVLEKAESEGNGKIFLKPSEYDNYSASKAEMLEIESRKRKFAQEKKKEDEKKTLEIESMKEEIRKLWAYIQKEKKQLRELDSKFNKSFVELPGDDIETDVIKRYGDSLTTSDDIEEVMNELESDDTLEHIHGLFEEFLNQMRQGIKYYHELYNEILCAEDEDDYKCPSCKLGGATHYNSRCIFCSAKLAWATESVDFLDLNFLQHTKPQGYFTLC